MDIITLKPVTQEVFAVLLTDDSIHEVADWLGADRIIINETLKTQHEKLPRKRVEFHFPDDANVWPATLTVAIGHYIVRAEPNRFDEKPTFRSETPANLHEYYRVVQPVVDLLDEE